MAQPTYKITDQAALEKACPQAYITTKTLNRPALTKLWNAAHDLGMQIPGVEAVEIEKALDEATSNIGRPSLIQTMMRDDEEGLASAPAKTLKAGKND